MDTTPIVSTSAEAIMSNPIVHTPEPQPSTVTPYLTVKEYLLSPFVQFQVVGIHDGWRPLCVRSLEQSLILVALVDLSAKEEAEIFHLLLPGEDLGGIQEGARCDLAFIGGTFDGRYLFLRVPREPEEPVRKNGRPEEKFKEEACDED